MALNIDDIKLVLDISKSDFPTDDYIMEWEGNNQEEMDEDAVEILEEYYPDIVKYIHERLKLRFVLANIGKKEVQDGDIQNNNGR